MSVSRATRTVFVACINRIPRASQSSATFKSDHSLTRGFRQITSPVIQARCLHQTSPLLGDRRFSDTHEWIEIDGNIATIGITDFAQDTIGNAVYVELPEIGKDVEKNDPVSCVESTKAVSDIYAPISGKIVEVNENLDKHPELLHKSCYGDGWIYKMEIKERTEFDRLLTEDDYNKHIEYATQGQHTKPE